MKISLSLENKKRADGSTNVDDVKLAWSDRPQASEPSRVRGNSNEAVFCVVGKSEGNSPEMKGKGSMYRSVSRNSAHQLSTNGPEIKGSNVNETASNALRRPKFSSAPDMNKVECSPPGELRSAGLLSCFPSFKTGANKSKQYQLVVRSPNGSAGSPVNAERKLSRLLKLFLIFDFKTCGPFSLLAR